MDTSGRIVMTRKKKTIYLIMAKITSWLLNAMALSVCILPSAVLVSCNEHRDAIRECREGVCVTIDTLENSVSGIPSDAVMFKGKLVILYDLYWQETTEKDNRRLVIADPGGRIINQVQVPDKINSLFDPRFILDNDSLYLIDERYDTISYLFDDVYPGLKEAARKPLKMLDDRYYSIYSTCYGEWGGTVYFTDKATGESFEVSSGCAVIVNSSDSGYFVTEIDGHSMTSQVIRINDPHKLEPSVPDYNAREGSYFTKGSEVIMPRTDLYILTSFFINNQLVHLYTDHSKTYLGKVENQKLVPFYTFDFHFYTDLHQQLPDGTQLLTFIYAKSEYRGLMFIKGNEIYFNFQRLVQSSGHQVLYQ